MQRWVIGFMLAAQAAFGGVSFAAAEGPAKAASSASAPARKSGPTIPDKLININDASRAQLKTLPGIGDAEADKIVAGRPYLSKADLVTKNVLPAGVYMSLRRSIFVGPSATRAPAGKGQS